MRGSRRLTREELEARYPDAEWREKLRRILHVTEFLVECILKADYKIPDHLNNVIALSDFGRRVHQELVTKHEVPAKEARVMCLLSAVYTEPLVDVERTDIGALEASLGQQIKDGLLLFPFLFGRELYDRAAELFEDERRSLNYQDTIRLLDNTSIGVFQLGGTLIGPYGVLRSAEERYVSPTRRIPLYHCPELTCDAVHKCRLSSDSSAPINEHMPKLSKVLEKEAAEPWPWGEWMVETSGMRTSSYDDLSLETLPYLLGDALTDDELRSVLVRLLDNTGGRYRGLVSALGLQGQATSSVATLSRAQMIQLLLLARDEDLVRALDHLVLAQNLEVPAGETRRPVVNGDAVSGPFQLQVQLGPFGCRVHSRADIGPLRLKRLVDGLYLLNEEGDVTELDWQLREVDAPSLTGRLEEYVRSFTPEQVVRRLVLARRTNMIAACTSLGIDEHRSWADDDLVSAVLWKLDFVPRDERDASRRFWQLHERMKQVTQTAGVSALVDQESVRALASNYFVLLEEFLDDALAFSTWALTNDHISSRRPFAYRAIDETGHSFGKLSEYEQNRESGPESIQYSGKNTLYELTRGFGSLAGLLRSYLEADDQWKRAEESYPRFVAFSNLKRFPFVHTVPFLDLLSSSQESLLEVLDKVGRVLVAADVSGVRNDQLHFRRSTADLGRLSDCLSAVEGSLRLLEEYGLTRLLFGPLRDQGDEWSRRIITLADPRGREIAIARPSSYDWLLLPGLRRAQYLMTSAVFAEPNEFLRFREDVDSPYARMWAERYPRRRSQSATRPLVEGLGGPSTAAVTWASGG